MHAVKNDKRISAAQTHVIGNSRLSAEMDL